MRWEHHKRQLGADRWPLLLLLPGLVRDTLRLDQRELGRRAAQGRADHQAQEVRDRSERHTVQRHRPLPHPGRVRIRRLEETGPTLPRGLGLPRRQIRLGDRLGADRRQDSCRPPQGLGAPRPENGMRQGLLEVRRRAPGRVVRRIPGGGQGLLPGGLGRAAGRRWKFGRRRLLGHGVRHT